MKEESLPAQPASKGLLVRYFTEMPIFFPLIGLFLLAITIFEGWSFIGDDSVSRIYWFRPAVMFLYFIFWSATCLARKWGAIAFIVLTILNVSFHLFGPDMVAKRALGDLMFLPIPVNLLFSFLLLFFFRKFK
jgi:hypothetical protein